MILCICASHKRATVPLLESLVFKDEKKAMQDFVSSFDFVNECIIVQTCNRVEIYLSLDSHAKAIEALVGLWSRQVGVSEDIIRQVTEVYQGREALLHLLRLSSGLESMVVGEDQILGQVRKTFVTAKEMGTTGLFLKTVFMKAINVGRRVRTETAINQGSVSISSVAVDLAEEKFGDLDSLTALVVGAGEAGTIVAEELSKRKVQNLLITNRTFKRGYELATKVNGKAIKFEEIYQTLPTADLAFIAVNTNKPILTANALEKALKAHKNREKLLLVDISQPRAVEEAAGKSLHIILKNIDDLKEVIERNIQERWKEAEKVNRIIADELERLDKQLGRMLAEPLVSEIFSKVEGIRKRELKKALQMMKGLDENQRVVVEELTKKLMERILQIPVESLREAALNQNGSLLSTAETLFNLEKKRK